MIQGKVEQPLRQVRDWKKKVSTSTKGMTPEQAVEYFRRGAEEMWHKYGYNCIDMNKSSCRYSR